MKRLCIMTAIFFLVFAMACKKSSEIPAREGAGSNSGTTQSASSSSQSSTTTPVPVSNSNVAVPLKPAETVTALGMNPPHGQPNHRCDISVGAPLNSPSGVRPISPTVSQQNVPAQASTPSTAPGMNPPHGQPNHRCDIAVGVPLDSPPGTGKSAPPAGSPLINPSQGNTAPTAQGMNPPHGQPNHRCDISVGAPLNSPPGTGKQQTPNTTGPSSSTGSPPIKIVPTPK